MTQPTSFAIQSVRDSFLQGLHHLNTRETNAAAAAAIAKQVLALKTNCLRLVFRNTTRKTEKMHSKTHSLQNLFRSCVRLEARDILGKWRSKTEGVACEQSLTWVGSMEATQTSHAKSCFCKQLNSSIMLILTISGPIAGCRLRSKKTVRTEAG